MAAGVWCRHRGQSVARGTQGRENKKLIDVDDHVGCTQALSQKCPLLGTTWSSDAHLLARTGIPFCRPRPRSLMSIGLVALYRHRLLRVRTPSSFSALSLIIRRVVFPPVASGRTCGRPLALGGTARRGGVWIVFGEINRATILKLVPAEHPLAKGTGKPHARADQRLKALECGTATDRALQPRGLVTRRARHGRRRRHRPAAGQRQNLAIAAISDGLSGASTRPTPALHRLLAEVSRCMTPIQFPQVSAARSGTSTASHL